MEQFKCLFVNRQIEKQIYSAAKRNEMLILATTIMNLKKTKYKRIWTA